MFNLRLLEKCFCNPLVHGFMAEHSRGQSEHTGKWQNEAKNYC